MGDWKAVRLRPEGTIELYDLKTDLGVQTHDVAAAHPDGRTDRAGIWSARSICPTSRPSGAAAQKKPRSAGQ